MALSNRWTEFEEVGVPDRNVVEQARLRSIPLPTAQLTDGAQSEYWKWCQRLLDIGMLDELMCSEIASYAISFDDLNRKIAKGQSTRYPQERIGRFLKKMRGIYEQHQPTSTARSTQDPYAHFGFAKRAGQRRHG